MYKRTINKHYDWLMATHTAGPWTQALRDLMDKPNEFSKWSHDEARKLVKTSMTSREVYELISYIFHNPSFIAQHIIYSHFFESTSTAKKVLEVAAWNATDKLKHNLAQHRVLTEDEDEALCYSESSDEMNEITNELLSHEDKMYWDNLGFKHIANLKHQHEEWEKGVPFEEVVLPYKIDSDIEDEYTNYIESDSISLLRAVENYRGY